MLPSPPYNEPELLRQVSHGDVTAFGFLFDHYRNKVYFIARQLLHSDSAAEDAVQDIFLKIWIHRRKLAELGNFNAYLNTITRNHIYNVLRKQAGEEQLLKQMLETAENTAGDTLETVSFHELQQQLRMAMGTLSPRQKKVFELSRLEGMKQQDIAHELGLSRETVKKYLADALQKLRGFLGDKGKNLVWIPLVALLSLCSSFHSGKFSITQIAVCWRSARNIEELHTRLLKADELGLRSNIAFVLPFFYPPAELPSFPR